MSDLDRFAERYEVDAEALRRWVIEAMVLGAVADGEFDRRESETIVGVITSQAEFAGIQPDELREDLERAFQGIVSDGFHVRLHALAGGLPRYAHRVIAFRAAVLVAFANGRLDDDEFSFLRQMQKVLGITEADVAQAFDQGNEPTGGFLTTDPEPVEAYLDCLLMAAAVDRELAEEELATIIAFVVSRDEFDGLDEDILRDWIRERLQRYASGGIDERLATIPDELPDPAHRENAWGLAASMVVVDGDLRPSEKIFIEKLRVALDLDEARADLVLRGAARHDR
jgi:tellurite resistance protein